jgi:hypothetical protein
LAVVSNADCRRATFRILEIGPHVVVLNCIRNFEGSFDGRTIYQNGEYIPPNTVRLEKNN